MRLENRDTRERTHLFKIILNNMPTIVTCVITSTRRVHEPELDQRRVVLRDVAEVLLLVLAEASSYAPCPLGIAANSRPSVSSCS